jgi:hypothetical protein
MHINCLDLSISDNDLNSIIQKRVPPNDKISNLRVAMKTGKIIVSGTVRVLLPVNFEADFELSHTDNDIIAHLAEIRPMSAIADQFKNKILEKITDASPFLQLDKKNESIKAPINEALQNNGVVSNLVIEDLNVSDKKLQIKVQGDVGL